MVITVPGEDKGERREVELPEVQLEIEERVTAWHLHTALREINDTITAPDGHLMDVCIEYDGIAGTNKIALLHPLYVPTKLDPNRSVSVHFCTDSSNQIREAGLEYSDGETVIITYAESLELIAYRGNTHDVEPGYVIEPKENIDFEKLSIAVKGYNERHRMSGFPLSLDFALQWMCENSASTTSIGNIKSSPLQHMVDSPMITAQIENQLRTLFRNLDECTLGTSVFHFPTEEYDSALCSFVIRTGDLTIEINLESQIEFKGSKAFRVQSATVRRGAISARLNNITLWEFTRSLNERGLPQSKLALLPQQKEAQGAQVDLSELLLSIVMSRISQTN